MLYIVYLSAVKWMLAACSRRVKAGAYTSLLSVCLNFYCGFGQERAPIAGKSLPKLGRVLTLKLGAGMFGQIVFSNPRGFPSLGAGPSCLKDSKSPVSAHAGFTMLSEHGKHFKDSLWECFQNVIVLSDVGTYSLILEVSVWKWPHRPDGGFAFLIR